MKKSIYKIRKIFYHISLRNLIWVSFTVTSAIATIIMLFSFYSRFSGQLRMEIQKEHQALIKQVNAELVSYLRTMMRVSDTLCFSVIKGKDMDEQSFMENFQLLYDTNKDYIQNIALFSDEGELLVGAPAVSLRKGVEPRNQEWFELAMSKTENMHFSTPHVQNLFINSEYQYNWVISLSRVVQITRGSEVKQGILLIDINYRGIKQLFSNVALGQDSYIYLVDNNGEIIYHPKQQLIYSNFVKEENLGRIHYHDSTYEKNNKIITTKIVGYTGWNIIGVTSENGISLNSLKSNLFFLFLILFFIMAIILINSFISSKVSKPIQQLESAVNEVEHGNLSAKVEVNGFYEVRHLGKSVQRMAKQIKKLMKDIIIEHESKRKSELNSLQSQINPHFLYNTLDVIVWMIENERQEEASKVVTALARFFRISLSKGENIISVKNEVEHARNYLMIQNMRYKNKFMYYIEVGEEVKELATIKLILQPLVENAIYHGMEFTDGDGEIRITVYKEKEDLYLSVEDNGLGMTEEKVNALLSGEITHSTRGSGIGVKNVDERIKLYFGQDYGLRIESEPDEGTKMTAHLPAVFYEDIKREDNWSEAHS